jgi:hypothetical protein
VNVNFPLGPEEILHFRNVSATARMKFVDTLKERFAWIKPEEHQEGILLQTFLQNRFAFCNCAFCNSLRTEAISRKTNPEKKLKRQQQCRQAMQKYREKYVHFFPLSSHSKGRF